MRGLYLKRSDTEEVKNAIEKNIDGISVEHSKLGCTFELIVFIATTQNVEEIIKAIESNTYVDYIRQA